MNCGILLISVWITLHIEAYTKLPSFSRRHFQIHFLEWISFDFDSNITKVYSKPSNWQQCSFDSVDGLVPNIAPKIFSKPMLI